MKIQVLVILMLFALTNSCKKESNPPDEVIYGRNDFTLMLNGDSREYIVQIPAGYQTSTPIPVVFMLHGTSQNGEDMYITSGWKEVGESETLITVFPSAWKQCIMDEDGSMKTTTKWNSQPAHNWSYCPGTEPRDDIEFLHRIIDELAKKYTIDQKRIYLVGFSNGGQMAAKCSVLLSDQIAAIVESASSFSFDTTFTPLRKIPVTFQIGNDDHGPGNTGPELPLSSMANAIQTPNTKLNYISKTNIQTFALNPTYSFAGDTNSIRVAIYHPADNQDAHIFQMALINGLKHAYPNGTNHWLHAAAINWEWLKQYTLP